tara:strand:+ start:7731 stop:8282 length:552 start_codon:yes stop_codon:yes gene_type:complete
MNEKEYGRLANLFEQSIEGREEYETKHTDAGNNYAHMLRDGDWCYSNGDDRLKAFLTEHDIITTPGVLEQLTDWCLDWIEPTPGHIFSRVGGDVFHAAGYTVGEVEDQYCLTDLADLLDVEDSDAIEFVALAMDDNRFCLRPNGDGGVLSYTNTDATWEFNITANEIREMVEEWTKEEEEDNA